MYLSLINAIFIETQQEINQGEKMKTFVIVFVAHLAITSKKFAGVFAQEDMQGTFIHYHSLRYGGLFQANENLMKNIYDILLYYTFSRLYIPT